MQKPTKQGQKGSTTSGVTGETTLTGEKPDHQRKRDTKRKRTTRKVWVVVKRDVKDD